MKFISICSGIEAASVAFAPLGWKAIAFSEIEPFPCAVLAHHYPDVPNFGDMTKFREWPEEIFIEADAIVGGPPCQAFSVAGLRAGLSDDRGNLTLTYAELINHADAIRTRAGKQPVVVLYENVPGLLSDKTGAFGSLLGALAGEDGELQPPGKKWTNAGCVSGSERALAWAVTDAQFFGVAQRRRRVFLIGSARDGFNPAAILFEPDGLRRDTAPSRESREVAPTIPSRSTAGGGIGTDFDLDGGVITMAHGQGGAEVARERSPTLTCNHEAPIAAIPATTHTLRGEGFDASEDGTGRGTPLVPVAVDDVRYAYYSHDYANDRITDVTGINPALTARNTASGNLNVAVPIAFHPTQDPISSTDGTTHALGCGSSSGQASVAVAFSCKDYGADAANDIAPTMRAIGHAGSHPNAGGHLAVAIQDVRGTDKAQNGRGWNDDGTSYTLDTHATQGVAYTTKLHNTGSNNAGKIFEERTTCLDANSPPPALLTAMQVRRLTPVECERLQGFPDGYTDIPWTEYQRIQKRAAKAGSSFEAELKKHGKVLRGPNMPACPDGPRYKALGNSWAVPNVAWIGRRIQAHLDGLL